MSRIGNSTVAESILVVSKDLWKGEWGVTANRYRVPFVGDGISGDYCTTL